MSIRLDELLALPIPDLEHDYSERDTMLYALGTGFGADPMDASELAFVYEEGLRASPTLATVVAWDRSWTARSGIDWPLVVHGDQRLTIHRPLAASAAIVASARVSEVLDKGKDKGALVRVETTVRERESGLALWTTSSGFFARGDGGFSAAPMKGPALPVMPERAPDAVLLARTQPNQALMYRLCGDRNPLHAVPKVAARAGFSQPVLHGLCTYGYACRAVLHSFCDLDPARIEVFDARFSAPVFPGESLQTEMWRDGATVWFRVRCLERDSIVLDNGRAVLRMV